MAKNSPNFEVEKFAKFPEFPRSGKFGLQTLGGIEARKIRARADVQPLVGTFHTPLKLWRASEGIML